MKRFGVRLAGATGVVLLGILAASQAQQDPSSSTADLERELLGDQPAAPIAAVDDQPWSPETTIFRGNDDGAADAASLQPLPADPAAAPSTGNVQLAGHEQPVAAPEDSHSTDANHSTDASEGPGFAAGSRMTLGGGFAAPAMPSTANPQAEPAESLAQPPEAAQPTEAAQPAGDEAAAGPGFSAGPSLAMPGSMSAPAGEAPATMPTDSAMDPAAAAPVAAADLALPAGVAADASASAPPAAAQVDAMAELDLSSEAPEIGTLSTQNVLRSDPADENTSNSASETAVETLATEGRDGAAAAAPGDLAAMAQQHTFQPAEMVSAAATETEVTAGAELAAAPPSLGPAAGPAAAAAVPAAANQAPASAASATDNRSQAAQPAAAPTLPAQTDFPPQAEIPSQADFPSQTAAAQPLGRIASRDTNSLPAMQNVMAQPGDRRWEGAQAPSVLIHKRAPEEVQVGKPATFVIDVRNVGTTDAYNVQVHDRVPDGMRLVDAMPQPTGTADALTWALGGLEPGGERSITLQLVPEAEGELGSVARVTFEAAASVRTISTRPELRIRQRAPERVLIGQQLELEINIENIGTGTATGVVLQEDVPEGLEHPKGRQLDNLLGDLGPGESRTQILRLRATAAGTVQNVVRLISDDQLTAEDAVAVEVVAPRVALELQGPSKRFLERPATYNIAVANIGTANATNVELVAYLDRGFSFVSTENEGQYDPSRHAIYWSLAELPTGANGTVPLTLLPVEEGEQAVRLEVTGDLGIREENEKLVLIDTLAELSFAVADDQDPVEIGSETTYEIRVNNSGSRGDTNVQLQIQLPPELELVSADRNAGTDGRGLVAFEPLPRLDAQGKEVYRVRVRGKSPGTHKIQAILTSEQSAVPVTKEESTTVYSDR